MCLGNDSSEIRHSIDIFEQHQNVVSNEWGKSSSTSVESQLAASTSFSRLLSLGKSGVGGAILTITLLSFGDKFAYGTFE